MTIEQGSNKQTRIKRQSAKGVLAGSTGGQIMRRENSKFELAKEAYTSESEITSTKQLTSVRHGVKTVNGNLDGLLSPGTYTDPLSSILRRDFAAIPALTNVSITIAGTGPYTLTRSAGSFLSDGIKIGQVVRLTAGSFTTSNLNKNLLVTNVSASVLTVLVLNNYNLIAEGPIASATVTVPGKVSYIPDTAHTDIYYTVEEWYPGAGVSERNLDVKFSKVDLALPGNGNSTIKFSAIGLDQTADTSAYFSAPLTESSSDVLAAANGVLLVNGQTIGTVTSLSISIDGKAAAADGVVGATVRPDVFRGNTMVTGSFTVYFEGGAIPDLYRNETPTAIVSALTAGTAANAEFMTLSLSSLKLSSSTPDDGQAGLKRTFNFTAYRNSVGGPAAANYASTIMVHDSLAA